MKLIALANQDFNAIVAAVYHYREDGLGEPGNRDDRTHDLACGLVDDGNLSEDISLDGDGLTDLLGRLLKLSAAKVYIVRGWHWGVPGEPTTVHATKDGADLAAADLVNVMVDDVNRLGTPGGIAVGRKASPENWAFVLSLVHRARRRLSGDDADCGVEVTELDLLA